MAVKWRFAAFTNETLDTTCKTWAAEARKGEAFPGEVEQVLDWVKKSTVPADGKTCAYGIFPDGDKCATGICDVVVSKQGRRTWVKHLRLRLRPSLDDKLFDRNTEAVTTAMEVFGHSAAGAMALKTEHNASTLKVYGRTKEQLSFLQAAAAALKKLSNRHAISIEGRFLVITSNPKDEA